MKKIKSEIVDIGLSEHGNARNKSILGSATHKPG